jgi:hypothetical protein
MEVRINATPATAKIDDRDGNAEALGESIVRDHLSSLCQVAERTAL